MYCGILWFKKYINVKAEMFIYNCCILSPFLLGASGTSGPARTTCKCIKKKSLYFSIVIALYKHVKHLISCFSHSLGTTWTTRTKSKFCNNHNVQYSPFSKVKIAGSSSNALLLPLLHVKCKYIFLQLQSLQ